MWAVMVDDDAAGDGDLARGCEGSVKKQVVIFLKRRRNDDDCDDDNDDEYGIRKEEG